MKSVPRTPEPRAGGVHFFRSAFHMFRSKSKRHFLLSGGPVIRRRFLSVVQEDGNARHLVHILQSLTLLYIPKG